MIFTAFFRAFFYDFLLFMIEVLVIISQNVFINMSSNWYRIIFGSLQKVFPSVNTSFLTRASGKVSA